MLDECDVGIVTSDEKMLLPRTAIQIVFGEFVHRSEKGHKGAEEVRLD